MTEAEKALIELMDLAKGAHPNCATYKQLLNRFNLFEHKYLELLTSIRAKPESVPEEPKWIEESADASEN